MPDRDQTVDGLTSPYGEDMEQDYLPAMSYFSEGGEVDDEEDDDDRPLAIPMRPVYRASGSPPRGEQAVRREDPLVSGSARMLRNITGEARSLQSVETPFLGSLGRGVQNVSEFVSAPFGYENPPARMLLELLGVPATGRAMEDVAQGLPLTRGKGQATQLRPDTAEALINVAPLAPVVAKTGAKLATKGAKKALQELGPTAASMAESLAARTGAGPMYALKPSGGNFMPAGFDSRLDQYIDEIVKNLSSTEGLAGKDAKEVADFIRTKGRKYFTTDYGSPNDPFRTALAEGRLGVYAEDQKLFRDYLLDAAREGRPTALEDLERIYDATTGLKGLVYGAPDNKGFAISRRVEEAQRKALEAAGVSPENINVPNIYPYSSKELLEARYNPARMKMGELLKAMEELPPELHADFIRGVGQTDPAAQSLLYAAKKEQPIYDLASSPDLNFLDPKNVAEDVVSIVAAGSLKDLQRMTFPEAVIRGAQNMRFKRDWQTVIQTARDGKTVPKEVYFKDTSPVYEIDKNQQWVRIMSPDAVELEGAAMRHSVGDYKYKDSYGHGGKEGFKSGRARIYSLRNEKGVPKVTVQTEFTDDGLDITQVKSKFNSAPTKEEQRAVFELFDTLGPRKITSETYRYDRAGNSLDEADRPTVNWGDLYNQYKSYKEGTQGFAGGGIVKKAAQALTKMGAKESQVAGKELTTLQDTYTSLGDRINERVAKAQQQMDAMEFKYKPGQRVFTADSAKKNKPPYIIKSKRLYGDQPVTDPKTLKTIRDPETGKAKRTPYEPGYLVRDEKGPGGWVEYLLPESAIKGSIDEFSKGGRVSKKLPGKRKYI
jgi:hypothetical protein